MNQITMVIPTYNDLDSLKELISLIEKEKSQKIIYLIVDNGSNNPVVTEVLSEKSDYWKSIKLHQNQGFGGGIREGILAANTEWIGWMPGNLKILPKDVDEMLSRVSIKSGSLIKCLRKRKSLKANVKTFLAGLIQSMITGKSLFDTGGTPTICERKFFLSISNLPKDYILESRILFESKARGVEILRPKIAYGERRFGQSHWQRGFKSELKLMKDITNDSFQIRREQHTNKNRFK